MADYLKYRIINLEPMCFADRATSQGDQMDTLRYVPGSAVRGYVVNSLIDRTDFGQDLSKLFSEDLAFMNAYLSAEGRSLIPSPKGFYEDKRITEGEKEIQNVTVDGSFSEGFKRAALGRYSYIESGCIHYFNVKTGADMKILMNTEDDRKVFRSEYIAAGQTFEGYIRLTGDEDLDNAVKGVLTEGKIIVLGNTRSAGLGKCRIVNTEVINGIPYLGNGFSAENEVYLILASDLIFRSPDGEPCGFDLENVAFRKELEEKLGVTGLTLSYASTSVKKILGYNRTWGGKTPSAAAYEAGSVYHLEFQGTLKADCMSAFCDQGLGIRKNEGFGRIIFIKDYEKVNKKIPGTYSGSTLVGKLTAWESLDEEEQETLRTAAKGYYRNCIDKAMTHYVVNTELQDRGLSKSRMGAVESRLMLYRYRPKEARENLRSFFDHAEEKEQRQKVQKKRTSGAAFRDQVDRILTRPLEETLFSDKDSYPFRRKGYVMGIPIRELISEEAEELLKIKLLIRMIRYKHKEV